MNYGRSFSIGLFPFVTLYPLSRTSSIPFLEIFVLEDGHLSLYRSAPPMFHQTPSLAFLLSLQYDLRSKPLPRFRFTSDLHLAFKYHSSRLVSLLMPPVFYNRHSHRYYGPTATGFYPCHFLLNLLS